MIEKLESADRSLLEENRELARQERHITTRLLRNLRETERRRLFVDMGYPSLFEYVVGDLKFSKASAQRRIAAMRLLKELPEIEEKIESGVLTLSVIADAQRFFRQEAKVEKPLTVSEKRELLANLEGKSQRDVERELAIRSSDPAGLRPETVRAVSATHSELRLVIAHDTLDKLERIRGLLGHTHHEMSFGELVATLAKMALEKLDPTREPKRRPAARAPGDPQPKKLVPAQKPTKSVEFPGRAYIKTALRREIWKRANGQCQLCRGLYRLQVDHVTPLAKGGTNEITNLRLICFHCNQRQADLKLGFEKMERFRGVPSGLINAVPDDRSP